MEYHRYSLSRKGKSICPECERKTFVLYVDTGTGKPLHSTVGKCDRADNCGLHCTPKQYFADNRIFFDTGRNYTPHPKTVPKSQPSFIDMELVKKSLSHYAQNRFAKWLAGTVGEERANEAINRYFVGTSRNGGTCFWQIDLQGKVRTGKIIVYGSNGHRRKDIMPPVQWVHSVLKLSDFVLSQCLFGEHLLNDKSKPVAVVESEKSAIVASIYLPAFIWLACGGSEGLNVDKCTVLKGRNVVLFPDYGQYRKWSAKAKELSKLCSLKVSSLIEERATDRERQTGFDIADYLVLYAPSEFIRTSQSDRTAQPVAQNNCTHPAHPAIAAMIAKNAALSRLMKTFDCEVTGTERITPKTSPMLSKEEQIRLAAGLPDHNSFSEAEICQILKIESCHVQSMSDNHLIYFIGLTRKYCRSGCTPF